MDVLFKISLVIVSETANYSEWLVEAIVHDDYDDDDDDGDE